MATKEKKKEPGTFVTVCLTCSYTCHLDCVWPDNNDKQYCIVMKEGKCMNCPKNCHWDAHKNTDCIYYFEEEEKTITKHDLEKKYNLATN